MVKKIVDRIGVKNGKNLFLSRQKTILSGAFVIGVMLLLSAILGLVKRRLYASVISPGPELDVFFAAFRIPDLLFQLLIAGSLNAAFIPIFSQHITQQSRRKSWEFVSSVLSITFLVFVGLSVVIFIGADQLAMMLGSGFEEQQILLLSQLIRILIFAPIFLGISSFAAGVLQSFKHFLAPFFSPVVYNLGAIFGILVLYPIMGIKGAAIGIVLGALTHLLIQIPVLKHLGYQYIPRINLRDENFRKMIKLSLPRTVGVGIEEFKSIVFVNIGSFLPIGSISFFDLGQSIINLPVTIFGVSLAQASLPQLASLHARGEVESLRKTFVSSFNQILFWVMPVSVILIVLKIPVVRLIYGAGQFSWNDTYQTSWVVALFGIGIFAQALNSLMVRLYYAINNTKFPVFASLIGMLVSLAFAAVTVAGYLPSLNLGLFVIPTSDVKGLALAITLGAVVEFIVLLADLARRETLRFKSFIATPLKITVSAIVQAVFIYAPVKILDQVFIDTTRVINLVILVWLVVSFGITVYLFLTWILGVEELKLVFRILTKVRDFRANIEKSLRSPEIISTSIIEESTD